MTTMSGASVQSGNRSEAESVLQERFGRLSTMMAKGASAEELLEFLYWPEVVIAGEGLGKAYRGLEDLLPLAREYVAQMGKDCTWTLSDPIVSSGDVASSYVQVTCRYGGEKPDANYCALYVWQRRGSDWKVIHEQLCVGTMR